MRIDPLSTEITRLATGVSVLTDLYRVYKVTRWLLEEDQRMVSQRLTDKLKKAAGVAARATQGMEERADKLIAREADIAKRTEQAFGAHHAHLDAAEQGLDEVENALRLLSNEPPLRDGGTPGRPLPGGDSR